MKSSVAIYNSHDDAIHALTLLKDSNFSLNKVSIIGRVEIEDDKIHLKSNTPLIATPLIAGSAVGATLGLLAGIGLFMVPGLGFLFGAGAIVGAIGGLDLGIMAGGLGSILVILGIDNESRIKYEEHIKEGNYLLFIDGTAQEIEKAHNILKHEETKLYIH